MKLPRLSFTLICLFILNACQPPQTTIAPVPQSTLTSALEHATPSFQVGPAAGWTYWRAAPQPRAIYAAVANDSGLWMGTSYGALHYDPRTDTYTSYEELGPIKVVLPIENGEVWASGDSGIFYFDGQRWSEEVHTRGPYYYDTLGLDSQGGLWARGTDIRSLMITHLRRHIPSSGDTRTASTYSPPSWGSNDCVVWAAFSEPTYTHRSAQECQQLNAARPVDMRKELPFILATIDSDGSVWWVRDLVLHHRTSTTEITLKLAVDRVNMITPDATRGVWLATDQGLLYSDGVTTRSVSLGLEQHTLHDLPRNLAIDMQGNVWVITSQGAQRLPAHSQTWQDVSDFGLGPGENWRPIATIAAAREGGIWASHGWDLWRFGGSSITPPIAAPSKPDCSPTHLTTDREGNVWTPVRDGACVFLPGNRQWLYVPLNVKNIGIDSILVGGDGAIYGRGSFGQLVKFTGMLSSSTGIIPAAWQLVEGNVRDERSALGTDQQGGLWTITNMTREVWREYAGTKTAFGRFIPINASIVYWYFDSRSRPWLFDYQDLWLYDGQAWRLAQQPDVGFVRDMASDPEGRVWVAGDRGVAEYDPTEDK